MGTIVLHNPPTLTWTPLPGSVRYVVTVQRASGDTFSSPALSEPKWTVDRSLIPDETYTWQVAASVGRRNLLAPRPPEPAATFRMVSTHDETRLLKLPASLLLRGILFAQAGALDDAERQFQLIVSTDPDSDLAGVFLEQIRKTRRGD